MAERTGITTSAGAGRSMAISTSPVRDSGGNVIQVVEITQDVTERKRANEEIRRLNAELEQRRLNRTLTMISECNKALIRMDDEADPERGE